MNTDNLEEGLKKFDELTEDGEGAPATPDSVPGMGAPALPTTDTPGSGDVPLGFTKPKKGKRVKSFDEFLKKKD